MFWFSKKWLWLVWSLQNLEVSVQLFMVKNHWKLYSSIFLLWIMEFSYREREITRNRIRVDSSTRKIAALYFICFRWRKKSTIHLRLLCKIIFFRSFDRCKREQSKYCEWWRNFLLMNLLRLFEMTAVKDKTRWSFCGEFFTSYNIVNWTDLVGFVCAWVGTISWLQFLHHFMRLRIACSSS